MLQRFLLICVVASAALANDPASVASDFAVASVGDDRELALRSWAPGANRDAFAKRYDHARATRCRRVLDTDVTNVAIANDSATVDIELELLEWNASSLFRQQRRAFRAFLENDDAWHIVDWKPLERVIATEIAEAKTLDERRAIASRAPGVARARLPMALTKTMVELINKNQNAEADEVLVVATELVNDSGDTDALAYVLAAKSIQVRRSQEPGSKERAIEIAARAISIAEETGDPDALAAALLRYGRSTGDQATYERLLSFADSIEDPATVALAATMRAAVADGVGENRTAVRYAMQAKRYAEIANDPAAQMSAEMNLAGSYKILGDLAMARRHFESALAIANRAGFDWLAASLKVTIDGLDAPPGTLATESAQAFVRIDDRMEAELASLLMVGRAAACARADDDVESEAQVRLALSRKALHARPLDVWIDLATLRYAQERYGEALALFELIGEGRTLTPPEARVAAAAMRAVGRHDDAIALLEKTLEYVESKMQIQAYSLDQSRARLRHQSWIDSMLVRSYLESHRPTEALAAANAGKARVLRMLASDTPAAAPSTVERASAEAKLIRINRALRFANPSDAATIARLQDELTSTRTELRRLELLAPTADVQLPKRHRDGSMFTTPRGTVGLQFVVDEHSTLLFTFHGPTPSLRVHEIPIGQKELSKRVTAFGRAMEDRDAGWRAKAKDLYQLLLAPAEHELADARNLVVVPHGILWGVPFHALVDSAGAPLLERMAVEYRPVISASPAQEEDASRDGMLLAFANPMRQDAPSLQRAFSPADVARSLPDAEDEARAVESFYDDDKSHVYIGSDAQESRFKAEAPQASILHIATHAFADPNWPMYSALLLARPRPEDGEDGILEAREIAAMRLKADVAVLSACETARGEYDSAEGVIGLPWAFLAAGTPAVVVSQWKVASHSTSQLMIEFHSRLRRGATAADALRGAQRALRSQTRYAHPFYWAPFVTITGR